VSQVIDLARAVGNPTSALDALLGLGQIHHAQGRYALAVEALTAAHELARAGVNPASNLAPLYQRGRAHHALGRPERARQDWQEALAVLAEIDAAAATDVTAEEIRAQLDRL